MPTYAQCFGCKWCVVGVPGEMRSLSINDGIYCTWAREHKNGEVSAIDEVAICPRGGL